MGVALLKMLEQLRQVRVRSVTDSLFIMGIIILVVGVAASALKVDSWISIVVVVLGVIFLAVGLSFYAFFAIKAPEYLRSEVYQLRNKSLELLGDKENFQNPHLDKIIPITNPYDIIDIENNRLDEK